MTILKYFGVFFLGVCFGIFIISILSAGTMAELRSENYELKKAKDRK